MADWPVAPPDYAVQVLRKEEAWNRRQAQETKALGCKDEVVAYYRTRADACAETLRRLADLNSLA